MAAIASGIAETAKLIASLGFKDNFTPGAKKAMGTLGQLESTGYRVGQQVGKGLSNAATNLKRIGLVSAAGIGIAVHAGIESLATLEDAETSVQAAIKQTGKTGQVTATQIAGWANQIEADIGAAFDDKDITQAATTLLRFGKVTTANLKPALVVMTDLATKTGSVESASSLLAKALADPAKAAGKLSRVGVILTKTEQANIKALVKAGKVGAAQKVILDSLTKSTKGAAAASQGPYRRSLSVLADVTEDAQRALATGFLPVIEKVSKILSTELAKPETLKNIKSFGEGIAGGLDSLINIAKNLPWGAIGDAFKLAGAGGKALLSAFQAMPPWVQTAVLTGWGLNKLTGGALTGIVGELGKGVIGALGRALGITTPVVNIKAGVVNGAGGPGGAGGAAGFLSPAMLTAIGAIAIPAALAFVQTQIIQPKLQSQANGNTQSASDVIARGNIVEMTRALDGLKALPDSLNPLERGLYDLNANGVKVHTETLAAELARAIAGAKIDANRGGPDDRGSGNGPKRITDAVDARGDRDKGLLALTASTDTWGSKNVDEAAAIHASVDKGAGTQTAAVNGAKVASVAAAYGAAGIVATAVRANPPPIVNVNVSVTPAQIQKTTTIVRRYGPSNGSAGGDDVDARGDRGG